MEKTKLIGFIIILLLFFGSYSLSSERQGQEVNQEIQLVSSVSHVLEDNEERKDVREEKDELSSFKEEKLLKEEPLKKETTSLITQIKEHRVKKGESLWEIAQFYSIDIDTLIGANDITNMNWIKPGDILKILPIKGVLYQVAPGESLWTISRQFAIDMSKIVEANSIGNPDLVKPGKLLILPGAKPEFGYQERLKKKFIKPVEGRISSPFGMRWGKLHSGIDIAVNTGTNVKAASSGKIIYSGWVSGYGETVIIEHRKGLRTLYAHNSKRLVTSGQWVERGQVIAKSGNTGRSTGPHLHFEIQINGKPVNPMNYLK